MTDDPKESVVPRLVRAGRFKLYQYLDEGFAYFACPIDINKDSFLEMEAWLDATLNRLARRAGVERKKR